VNKPIQTDDQNNAVKQNKAQQHFNSGNTRYTSQKVENNPYHSREDSSAKIPACLNRQSSTLIYSSDGGDLGKFSYILNFKNKVYNVYLGSLFLVEYYWLLN
jgi:hypothetical protein